MSSSPNFVNQSTALPLDSLSSLSLSNYIPMALYFGTTYLLTKPKSSKLLIVILCVIIPPTEAAPGTRSNNPAAAASSAAAGAIAAVASCSPIGSDSYPNMVKDWDFLPGMKRWNGQPFYDFARIWWIALVVALGTIVQDGNSLLACAEGNDEGSDATNDPPDKIRQHNSRNARLFACILNYVSPTSRVYRISLTEFANDGHGLFVWLREYGKLEYDDTTRRELVTEWDEATMAKVGIRFTPNAIWEWLEYIETLGDKLGRSLSQRRKKLLAGFPESFDVVASPERLKPDPGSYILSANYRAHHPKSGQPDPNAGRPDLYALCKAFYPEWHYRIKSGQIKSIPRGSVYEVDHADVDSNDDNDVDDDNSDDQVMYTSTPRKQITSKSVCGVCGGRGHYSKVEGMECLTKQLGIMIPRSELAQTKYPSGITFPFSNQPGPSSASHRKSSHGADFASSTTRPSTRQSGKSKQFNRRPSPRPSKPSMRYKPKRVSQVDEHEDDNEEHNDKDDHPSSEGDAHVDFATLAVSYSTIDTRRDVSDSCDESSDEPSTPRHPTRHPTRRL